MTTSTASRIFLVRATIGTAVIVGASLTVARAQVRDRDPRWAAPPEAATRVNPLLNRSDATAGGEKLFQQRCATCHGEDGRGTARAPNLNGREVQAQTDGELFWKISTGNTRPGMPAFSFLPEPQRWQLVLSLRRRALRQD
jgi:mono/diheme cytochrome c family protein